MFELVLTDDESTVELQVTPETVRLVMPASMPLKSALAHCETHLVGSIHDIFVGIMESPEMRRQYEIGENQVTIRPRISPLE